MTNSYKDEGWSGALMARPHLDRLRDDAKRHLFDAVLINDVDRLAREVAADRAARAMDQGTATASSESLFLQTERSP